MSTKSLSIIGLVLFVIFASGTAFAKKEMPKDPTTVNTDRIR